MKKNRVQGFVTLSLLSRLTGLFPVLGPDLGQLRLLSQDLGVVGTVLDRVGLYSTWGL